MRVVIIDDNEVNVTVLKHLVTTLPDCEPVGFTVSEEAVEWCRLHECDLVLVDYMMPAPDGLEFIEQFRAIPGKTEIPIVMITADHKKDVRYRALELGATDFLTKPVDRIEFLARTRNMLALRRSQKQLANRAAWLADEVRKATAQIVAREQESIYRLSRAAEHRDPETGAHIMRVAHYSAHIARNLGLSEEDQDLIMRAAPMHDIGKVGIPDYILFKPARLDEDEWKAMQEHTVIGHEILRGSASLLLQAASDIALTHHEKWDGSGYPHGLKGEAIPLFSRIVAVADVFDALLSDRPYRARWDLEHTTEMMRQAEDRHFDPMCLQAFFAHWDRVLAIRARISSGLASL